MSEQPDALEPWESAGERVAASSDQPSDGAAPAPARRRPVAPFIALAVAALLSGLVFVFAGATGGGSNPAATPLLNKPAPAAQGLLVDDDATITDRTWYLSRQKGGWVVLNFFDSTCVPCVREHPELVQFAADQQVPGGAELVSVAWGADTTQTRASVKWLRANGATWDIVYDNGSIANAFAVAKVPETWLVDPYGVVRARYISEVTAEQLNAQLAVWTGTAEPSGTDASGTAAAPADAAETDTAGADAPATGTVDTDAGAVPSDGAPAGTGGSS